jgi:protocatechuate 3,4-dioxygenase alpha subunit
VIAIFSRGMLRQVYTRLYFSDETANAKDTVLALVPADRRDTLIAKKQADGSYRFDIHMQGDKETVFFEV